MQQTNYFYIVTNDNQIFEIPYTEERIAKALGAMKDKEIYTVKGTGMIINGAYISKILDTKQYENYVNTVKPTRYIRNGTWKDGKERRVISHEPWKQKQIDDQLKIGEDQDSPQTPQEEELATEMRKEVDAFLKSKVFK